MSLRNLAFPLLAPLALLAFHYSCAGCSSASLAGPEPGAEAFRLQVWDESYVDGGRAGSYALELLPAAADGTVELQILARRARGLKALYCELRYDARRYEPVTDTDLGAGSAYGTARMLRLLKPLEPGVLHYGQVLAGYTEQAGFTGSGVIASLRLVPRTGDEGEGRQVSAPPVEPLSVNETLQVDGTGRLSWRYYCPADYDLNGEVNIADLTPLGANFGLHGPFEPLSVLNSIDGDHNGEINIADITPIGAYYHDRVSSYRVYQGDAESDWPNPFGGMLDSVSALHAASSAQLSGEVAYSKPAGALTERPRLQFQLAGTPSGYYWVRTYDDGSEGNVSNWVRTGAPEISVVQPQSGFSGDSVICSAAVSGTVPFSYSWDFGGGASPNLSTQAAPQVMLGAEGNYDCSLTVSNAFGSDSFDYTLQISAPPAPEELELWYYIMQNLLPDQGLNDAIDLLNRAAAAGYTTVVHSDYKFSTIDLQSETYYQHLATYAQAAEAAGVTLIPGLVPIGYSNGILNHDPNLIEGQPVRDCIFEVSGSSADVWQDPATTIQNGGFENHSGDSFSGWNQMDGAGLSTFADSSTVHGDSSSMRFENFAAGNPTGNDRITQTLSVAPWNCYAVSLWLKTDGVAPAGSLWFRIFSADADFRQLTHLTYNVQSTQDWTHYYLIFNSQEKTQVYLYLGLWGGESGRFWIDDVSIENTGLINLLRRPGAPLSVKSEDGAVEYSEGVDYAYVSDPELGTQGSWNMDYDLYHARPVISILPGSAIHDGDRLKVSYYHAVFVYDMQPTCCLSEEGVFDVIRDTLQEINTRLAPPAVFIGIDEMRVANWCAACQDRGLTPGELLASATQRIDTIAHEINPGWKLLTWSDMFDPNHNAVAEYYLVNGTLEGSWNGLPAAWEIGNWMSSPATRVATASFFAEHGNRQILCGYYDEPGPDYSIDDWLQAVSGNDSIFAVMYTQWWSGYDALEDWAAQVREWESQQPK